MTSMVNLKLREDFVKRQVVVYAGNKAVYRDSEYRGAAMWLMSTYNVSDADMRDIYKDYKLNYDRNMR